MSDTRNDVPPPLPVEPIEPSRNKVLLNTTCASILTLLSALLLKFDFGVGGDMLFQTPLALILIGIFLAVFTILGHWVAVVPKRFLLGLNAAVLVRSAFGYPFNAFLENTPACRITSAILLIVSILYLVVSLRGQIAIPVRPWFRWKHVAVTGVALLGFGLLSIPFAFGGCLKAFQNVMGDYIVVSPAGISLVERVFEKDGHKVHLVGMMHIGEADFYNDLNKRLASAPDGTRLVLTEGVGDKNNLLPKSFGSGDLYGKFAKEFDLQLQDRLDLGLPGERSRGGGHGNPKPADPETEEERAARFLELGVVFQNADMDISELDEKHRTLLLKMFDMMDKAPSLSSILMNSSQYENFTPEAIEDMLINGLLKTRNDVLMKHFLAEGQDHDEVYIPWGAAHLKDVEVRILELGYVETEEVVRPVVRFSKKG